MKNKLLILNIVFLAQVAALFFAGAVTYFFTHNIPDGVPNDIAPQTVTTFEYLLILFLLLGITGSLWLPKVLLRSIDRSLPLDQKLVKFFSAFIIRIALLEFPGLFVCVVVFITRQAHYLLIIPLILILFFFYRPTKDRVAWELELTPEEKKDL